MLTGVTHKDADILAIKFARLLTTPLRASLAPSILGDSLLPVSAPEVRLHRGYLNSYDSYET